MRRRDLRRALLRRDGDQRRHAGSSSWHRGSSPIDRQQATGRGSPAGGYGAAARHKGSATTCHDHALRPRGWPAPRKARHARARSHTLTHTSSSLAAGQTHPQPHEASTATTHTALQATERPTCMNLRSTEQHSSITARNLKRREVHRNEGNTHKHADTALAGCCGHGRSTHGGSPARVRLAALGTARSQPYARCGAAASMKHSPSKKHSLRSAQPPPPLTSPLYLPAE